MPSQRLTIVLGSRSPRRFELLQQIVSADRIEVVPPRSTLEEGFDGLDDWPGLEHRLTQIARTKCDDVLQQTHERRSRQAGDDVAAVVAADTIIVATNQQRRLVVLGQPPEDSAWDSEVRRWFREYYAGKTHTAMTSVCVATLLGQRCERVVSSQVTFHSDVEDWLDWYVATGEPVGKAGGYALQGAGGVFVSRVEGSISNVVGLPLRELLQAFEELGIDVG